MFWTQMYYEVLHFEDEHSWNNDILMLWTIGDINIVFDIDLL